MESFSIDTLGCKVNQYESEQIATLLRHRGLVQVDSPNADLRIVNTCSVTTPAASKSRQTLRRMIRLPVLASFPRIPGEVRGEGPSRRPRVIATGCWATSDPEEASTLGVDAVITHHDDVASQLDRLLELWGHLNTGPTLTGQSESAVKASPKPLGYEGSMTEAGASTRQLSASSKPQTSHPVKQNIRGVGTRSLPLLGSRQSAHQRALLKIQDGCDAHCTYCIIPQLRGAPWSKPVDDVLEEARRMVAAGHREIVLTGIFLGAYGQPTAIRRRQPHQTAAPLGALVEALCTRVPGLCRLRFSSLEPGDLTRDLLQVLRSHQQCVPHFHLPLQSGSDTILRRMNRQYSRDDFLGMIGDVREAFDRPAITTDIIVGFPGETEDEFQRTLDVVDAAKFIHIHAFSFSPRPGTAASRWTRDSVPGPAVNLRIETLRERSRRHSFVFRRQFIQETVQLVVEREQHPQAGLRKGRCERYFEVDFAGEGAETGDAVNVRVDHVTLDRTGGTRVN